MRPQDRVVVVQRVGLKSLAATVGTNDPDSVVRRRQAPVESVSYGSRISIVVGCLGTTTRSTAGSNTYTSPAKSAIESTAQAVRG